MCLSIPGQVIKIHQQMADVAIGGNIHKAGTHLMDDLKVGDYVLIHTGYIIQKINKSAAEETLKLLKELSEIDKTIRDNEK